MLNVIADLCVKSMSRLLFFLSFAISASYYTHIVLVGLRMYNDLEAKAKAKSSKMLIILMTFIKAGSFCHNDVLILFSSAFEEKCMLSIQNSKSVFIVFEICHKGAVWWARFVNHPDA